MNEYLKLDDLSVGYKGNALIRGIDTTFRKGEIVTLIGPNGAGKSTILKSITRQLSLVGGKVYLQEKDMHRMSFSDISRKMAVVLTERLKPELMTCRDLVATGRYPFTGTLGILKPEDEAKVTAAMEAVHVTEIAGRDFNSISDGQRQRVLLARAICQEPEIIILDEPTSFLDVHHKLELLAILQRMAKQDGIAIVMSLHEIDLAMKISDRIICVKGDRIFLQGAPDEIFDDETISQLYDIENGYFDALLGSIELPAVKGEPEVFVISAGGSGIPVYRRLQKEGIPFAAGILASNDIDCRVAKRLAVKVIETEPFSEIPDETIDEAIEMMERCGRVITAGTYEGTCRRKLERLLQRAEELGCGNMFSKTRKS